MLCTWRWGWREETRRELRAPQWRWCPAVMVSRTWLTMQKKLQHAGTLQIPRLECLALALGWPFLMCCCWFSTPLLPLQLYSSWDSLFRNVRFMVHIYRTAIMPIKGGGDDDVNLRLHMSEHGIVHRFIDIPMDSSPSPNILEWEIHISLLAHLQKFSQDSKILQIPQQIHTNVSIQTTALAEIEHKP